MPETAQFLVEEVFDLPKRGGLLVTGRVLAGRIAPGETLRDAVTGTAAEVLGVESHASANRPENAVTLVFARTDPTPVAIGRFLTRERLPPEWRDGGEE